MDQAGGRPLFISVAEEGESREKMFETLKKGH